MKKVLIWVLACSIEVALLYFAMKDVQWCWNLLRFGLWVMLVLTFLGAVGVAQKKEGLKDTSRSVPGWVSATFDVGVAGTLAAFGHFGYASIVLMQQIMEATYYKVLEDKKQKEEAK